MPGPNLDEQQLLKLAASLEQNSEHPLARAIVDAAKEKGVEIQQVDNFESTTGGGVSGQIGGQRVRKRWIFLILNVWSIGGVGSCVVLSLRAEILFSGVARVMSMKAV